MGIVVSKKKKLKLEQNKIKPKPCCSSCLWSPRWQRPALAWSNSIKSPVCFGAKGNQFGRFTYHRNIFVSSFMLVHRSGTVSCLSSHKGAHSFLGCEPNYSARLETILTYQNNKILAPEASTVSSGGQCTLATKKPHCVFANSELRLWHGEDLRDSTESDNAGRACADVYGLLA